MLKCLICTRHLTIVIDSSGRRRGLCAYCDVKVRLKRENLLWFHTVKVPHDYRI
jgi:hypothetical protein